MRNLKKILALALALVMTLSVMSVAGAKSLDSYTDAGSVSAKHEVAVDVATQLGILQGMTETTYAPQGTLTRAQLATMIYRITTGDVAGTYVSNFAAGAESKFSDVSADAWYAGFVGYCADAGYLQGMGDGTYAPNATLTGYQALAALLRAIGYNQPGEFTGPDWTVRVAQIATQSRVAAGVVTDLNKAITREQAAQFIYNALLTDLVSYTPAFGYSSILAGNNLASDVFDVYYIGDVEFDVWGRPTTVWENVNDVNLVELPHDPIVTYTTAKTDCEIAVDLGLHTSTPALRVVNGTTTWNVSINPLATTVAASQNGTGTGVLTEVYFVNGTFRLVEIDTYFAVVTGVTNQVVDAAGHVITPASITLTVYSDASGWANLTYAATGYAVGDYVLVNMLNSGRVMSVKPATYVTGTVTNVTYAALPVNGTITAGATYSENVKFFVGKDPATTVAYNLFMDNYGNVIAAIEPTYSNSYVYGVITAMKWVDTNDLLGAGYALANLMKVDATPMLNTILEANNTVDNVQTTTVNEGLFVDAGYNAGNGSTTVSSTTQYNSAYVDKLAQYILNADGSYDINAYATAASVTTVTPAVPTVVLNGSSYVATNDNTVYLVKTAANTYVSYTGYKNVPAMKNLTNVQYFAANGYITMIYMDASGATYSGSSEIVYIDSMTKTAEANGLYGFNVYAGTVAKTVYAATGAAPAGFTQPGVYIVNYNVDGKVLDVVNYFEAGNGIILTGVDYCNGTVIENVDAENAQYNCTGANLYKMAGGAVVAGNVLELTGNITAFMVTNLGVITDIYYFG